MQKHENITRCHLITSSLHHFIILVLCASVFIPLHAQTQKPWQWVKQIGSVSWDMAGGVIVDTKDNLYVAGSYNQTLRADNKKIVSKGGTDLFLARFDTKGNLGNIWSFGGKGKDEATCLAMAPKNTIIIGGSVTDSVAFGKLTIKGLGSKLFLAAIDSKGQSLWATSIDHQGSASLYLLDVDSLGNIYAAGTFSGSIGCEGQQAISVGKRDVFILRLDASGTINKLISFGSQEDETPAALTVNPQGEFSCSGSFTKPFAVGQAQLTTVKGKTSLFLLHFNQDMTLQWNKIFGAEDYGQVSAIRNDRFNNLYIAGNYNLSFTLSDTTFKSNGFTDAFVAKYAKDGTRLWAKSIGSDYYDYINHINIDNLDGIVVTGSIGNTLRLDSLLIQPPVKGDAAFIAQLNSFGAPVWGDCVSGTGRNFSNGSVLDKDGNLYLCGSFQNTFKRNDDSIKSYGDQDIFFAKYYNCAEQKVDFKGSLTLCPGATTELSVKNHYKTIVWNDTLWDNTWLEVNKPGKNKATIITKKGCRYTDSVEVVMAPHVNFSLGNDTSIAVGDSLTLKAPKNYKDYRWFDHSYGLTCIAASKDDKPGTEKYWIAVTDSLDCVWRDTIAIRFLPVSDLSDLQHLKIVTYPNPLLDNLNWYLETDKTCRLTVEVTDNYGHTLYNEVVSSYSSGQVKHISIDKMPSGAYLVRIKNTSTGKVYATAPIIKQ
jgi:hypothetical protein